MRHATIGIDISKAHFDAHRLPDRASRRFANSPDGFAGLKDWLAGWQVERIVFEASGAYTRAFEQSLWQAGLPLARVNARQARRFAEAIGSLAKTDQVDAAMLARMGLALEPPRSTVPDETQQQLRELRLARRALIKERTALSNRSQSLSLPLLRQQRDASLSLIDEQLAAIDRALKALAEQDPDLGLRLAILTSIPGLGETSAFALLSELPELGRIKAKPLASLVGLAPMTRQSGQWTGKASIRGGRAKLRTDLYLPAIVACRFNPDLKALYARLTMAGKPKKVAIVAVMRKLIILANALLRDRRTWTPRST